MSQSILVIDDEAPIRESLELLLKLVGYSVATAGNGRAGLDALAEAPFHLVITDIIMAGHEGIETILTMRKQDPDLKILAMSGGGRRDGRDFLSLARESGADACLEKPFEPSELLGTISRLLNQ